MSQVSFGLVRSHAYRSIARLDGTVRARLTVTHTCSTLQVHCFLDVFMAQFVAKRRYELSSTALRCRFIIVVQSIAHIATHIACCLSAHSCPV